MILNEFVIKSKTKVTDITTIKTLNCWGSALKDISILESLPSLEVLSLSVNSIESLQPLKNCLKLKELHIRNNLISDVNQILHLRGLADLTNLVLSENPICVSLGDMYRSTVLRHLPQLKKLDGKAVTPEELEEATAPESNQNAEETDEPDNSNLDTNVPTLNFGNIVNDNDREVGTYNFEELEETVDSELDIPILPTVDPDSNYSTARGPKVFEPVDNIVGSPTQNSENPNKFQNDMLACALSIVRFLTPSNQRVVQSMVRLNMHE